MIFGLSAAGPDNWIYGPTFQDAFNVRPIIQEIVYIEGVQVLFSLFNVDGMYVETGTIMEPPAREARGGFVTLYEPFVLPDAFSQSAMAVVEQRSEQRSDDFAPLSSGSVNVTHMGGPVNMPIHITHAFNYSIGAVPITQANLSNGRVTVFNPLGNAESITAGQTINVHGLAFGLSLPWSIAFSQTNNQQTWRSPTLMGAFTATWWWDRDISGTWVTLLLNRNLLTITTGADAVFRPFPTVVEGHSATVETRKLANIW